jgi:hypothetical protein
MSVSSHIPDVYIRYDPPYLAEKIKCVISEFLNVCPNRPNGRGRKNKKCGNLNV